MDAIEKRMKKYLPPKQYAEWSANRHKPWAETVETIPFGKYNKPDVTLDSIRKVFDKHISGRDSEKDELMHKAASFIVNGHLRRPLLFVGAPGEGKSCFAKHLASALGYPIRYINVPSLNSPIALCGTERHYDNSRIGILLQSLIEEETLSMVFVFDEIDKAVARTRDGSIESVLLGLFDPMWNGTFTDRSIGVPVDMSRCIFICTANDLSAISAPLIDRMDVIHFAPYTSEQALSIIKSMTIPNVIKDSGMKGKVKFAANVAEAVVSSITDGSMRDYEKLVEKLVDHAIYCLLISEKTRYTVTTDDIEKVWPSEKNRPLGFSG